MLSLTAILAIVITVLTCLHITYTVTYTPIKNKITGAKQKALETQKKQDAINQAVLKVLANNGVDTTKIVA
ncbi:hypothetical protein IKS57_05770 [bacterium]|nr:hypothetical protein [bacterium]